MSLVALLVVLIMGTVVSVIGYQQFTVEITEQYKESSIRTAKTAAGFVDADRLQEDYDNGGQSEEFRETEERLDWLTEFQDVTFVFVLLVDREDYGTTYFLYDSVNPKWSQYPRREVGFVEKTINEEYEQAYRDLYSGRRDSATVFMRDKDNTTGAHFTSMVPLKDSKGETAGIMCVHQQLSKVEAMTEKYLRSAGGYSLLLGVLTFILFINYLNHSLIRPLQKIGEETRRFSVQIDLPEKPLTEVVRTENEIGNLAAYIDQMERKTVDSVSRLVRISGERERIGAELSIASGIQAGIMPHEFPPFPDCPDVDLYAVMDPAREVGGDFYDFFFIDSTHFAMVIADVSGKGVPAALFMMSSKILIKALAMEGGTPSEILNTVNEHLCEGNTMEMFTTAWLGILDLETGVLTTSSAGHEYPAINDENGKFRLFRDHHAFVLGGFKGIKYSDEEIILPPGGKVFVYTDGLAEAMNAEKELFGTERIIESLNEVSDLPPKEILSAVRRSVDDFVRGEPQFDDLTMLCMHYRGRETDSAERRVPEEDGRRKQKGTEADGARNEDRAIGTEAIQLTERKEKREMMKSRKTIPARRNLLAEVQNFRKAASLNWRATSKEIMEAELALEELYVNIASYAYPDGEGDVDIEIDVSEDGKTLTMVVSDRGIPFNPLKRTKAQAIENLKKLKPGGLGIYMVQKYADKLDYRYEDEKNILTFIKKGTASEEDDQKSKK